MSRTNEMKPEPWGVHLLGLGPVSLVIAGNLVGGPWVLGGIVYILVIGPILDLLFGRATRPRPPRASGRPFELLLYVHAALQFAALGTLLYRAGLDLSASTTWGIGRAHV